MSQFGLIYMVVNPSMRGLIKVGYTMGALEERLKQLSTTGVPVPFEPIATFRVVSPKECEQKIHEKLESFRVSKNREFFQIEIATALEMMLSVVKQYIAPHTELFNAATPGLELDPIEVSLLQMLLHDEQGRHDEITTEGIVDSYPNLTQLQVEYRLLKLVDRGLVDRIKKRSGMLGLWRISPNGLKFMFDNNLVLQDLIDEERRGI